MDLLRVFLRSAAIVAAFVVAPAAASAQDWVARGVCTSIDIEAVSYSDADHCFAVGQSYILRSSDGGSSWAPLFTASRLLHDVGFRDASLGLAVGDGGLILRTTDGGQSWSEVQSNTTSDLFTVAVGEGSLAFAAGFGVALRSIDGGANWSLVDAGDVHFLGSAASGANRAWLVGAGGIVRATADGGLSWASQSSGTNQDLRGAFFISASRGWIAGAGGTLLYTQDGGVTWLPRSTGIAASLNSIHFVGPGIGWVVGSGGAILRTEDAGLSWVPESSFSADELLDVSFSPAGRGCAVGITCQFLLRSERVTAVGGAIPPRGLVVRSLENPTRAGATIRFGIPGDGLVRLRVLDVQGRLAAKLVEARLPAGWHEVQWHAEGVASGIYLAVLDAGGARTSAKIALGR